MGSCMKMKLFTSMGNVEIDFLFLNYDTTVMLTSNSIIIYCDRPECVE